MQNAFRQKKYGVGQVPVDKKTGVFYRWINPGRDFRRKNLNEEETDMKKKIVMALLAMTASVFAGCGNRMATVCEITNLYSTLKCLRMGTTPK